MPAPIESLLPDLHEDTQLVHAGTLRSQFGETSEALFLTQGHIYENAEQCEAR
ncbi:MAG: O-succinylhomoserine sulfhydrylase, partial [Methylobacterium sp.]|nr:O-succinylhomoserine sulfhydrylase [Methylobacterium sp.]